MLTLYIYIYTHTYMTMTRIDKSDVAGTLALRSPQGFLRLPETVKPYNRCFQYMYIYFIRIMSTCVGL